MILKRPWAAVTAVIALAFAPPANAGTEPADSAPANSHLVAGCGSEGMSQFCDFTPMAQQIVAAGGVGVVAAAICETTSGIMCQQSRAVTGALAAWVNRNGPCAGEARVTYTLAFPGFVSSIRCV